MEKNVFYLEENFSLSYIIKNARQNDISLKIDNSLLIAIWEKTTCSL